jgi:sulfotransferase
MNQLHFCGGLPRAGSTVLMNILQQNPKIFTTSTCALYGLLHEHMLIKSRYREQFQAMSVEQADKAMYGAIHGAAKGWFEGLTDKPFVISKNRAWSNLFHLFPKSKYICMVRDLRDVVESFERVGEKTLALHSFDDNMNMTTAMYEVEKYKYYFQESNSVSISIQTEIPRLMEVFKKQTNKVFFLRYEDFTMEPIYMLKQLYNFLEQDWFEHDLNNIQQSFIVEHDHAYFREKTDHVTSPVFQTYSEPKRTLPENFHNNVVKNFEWFYKGFYPNELTSN